MGCDGGTIPTRDELVKLKKKPEQKDKDGHRLFKWQHCALTQEALNKPIVACEMGKLYNKESVIELLLTKDRSEAPKWSEHLKQLKDVIELELTPNPAYTDRNRRQDAVGDGMYVDALMAPWICPVTGLEMNGRFKFVFSFSTGRIVAERALKVLRQDPAESGNYKEDDTIVMNPEEAELDMMNTMMIARRARVKAAKKAAKAAKKEKAGTSSGNGEFKVPCTSTSTLDIEPCTSTSTLDKVPCSSTRTSDKVPCSSISTLDEPAAKKLKVVEESKCLNGKLSSESNVTKGKVFNMFAEQKRIERESEMRPQKDMNFVKRSTDLSEIKKMKKVQESNASDTYKKLFTSHPEAKNRPVGNWVTFDPRYN